MKAAFYKRGVPRQLYTDNGSIYCSAELSLVCARTGCILRHTPVRDGASKGKIERFFRRLRDQFLSRKLDLSSLAILNKQLTHWIEDKYNASEHSAIAMKPVDRFAMDIKFIQFLSPNKFNDELFYTEATRKVNKDNTFSFKSVRWEPNTHLANRTITIRFDRNRPEKIIVYDKNQRIGEAKKLDLVANSKIKRGRT